MSSNLWENAGIVIAEQYKGTTAGTPTPIVTPTPSPTATPIITPRPIYATIATKAPIKPIETATPTPRTITAPSKPTKLSAKNNKKKSVSLSWKKVNGAAGYQIQYATNEAFSRKSKTTKKTKITIKKLKKKKIYSFRVRAYVLNGKKKIYSKWSKVKRIKIKR